MIRTLFSLAALFAALLLIVSCGPSEAERQARQQVADTAAEAKQYEADAVEVDPAAEEARRQAAAQAAAEREARRAAEAGESFREFMKMWSDNTNPRAYEKALTKVGVDGDALVLSLSINNRSEATSLCNFTLTGWSDRSQFSISRIQVKGPSGSVLSESKHLPTGAHVCQ